MPTSRWRPRSTVCLGDDPIEFTNREFPVLRLLMEKQDKLVSREDLAHTVWPLGPSRVPEHRRVRQLDPPEARR